MKLYHHELPQTAIMRGGPDANNAWSMRCCWPDWEGPKVTAADDPDPAGYAQCGLTVESLTHGDNRYHYCAPIKITEVDHRGTITGVICYQGDTHCVHYNGEIVRMKLRDLWPPVERLWAVRHAEEIREGREQGKTCACGSLELAHVYGGGFECAPCRVARMAEMMKPSQPEKKPKANKTAKPKSNKPAVKLPKPQTAPEEVVQVEETLDVKPDGQGKEGSPGRIAHAALPFPENMYFSPMTTRIPQPPMRDCICGGSAFLQADSFNIGKFYVQCSRARNPQTGECPYWPVTQGCYEQSQAVAEWEAGRVVYNGADPKDVQVEEPRKLKPCVACDATGVVKKMPPGNRNGGKPIVSECPWCGGTKLRSGHGL